MSDGDDGAPMSVWREMLVFWVRPDIPPVGERRGHQVSVMEFRKFLMAIGHRSCFAFAEMSRPSSSTCRDARLIDCCSRLVFRRSSR
jgi:hypothetical protein